jgi:hypothetical protein
MTVHSPVADPLLASLAAAWTSPSRTLRADIDEIGSFFGIGHTSLLMSELTGLNQSTLSRAYTGAGGVRDSSLVRELAEFARVTRRVLALTAGRDTPVHRENMEWWLRHGCFAESQRPALEALKDLEFVRQQTAEMRRRLADG